MARGPIEIEDRRRWDAIKGRSERLNAEVVVKADGQPCPSRECLKRTIEQVVYEDLQWLIERVEDNWS